MLSQSQRFASAAARRSNHLVVALDQLRWSSTKTAESQNGPGSGTSMEEYRQKLAQAAILQIPTHGWTQDAVTAAAMQQNMPIRMSGLWTPPDLLNWFMHEFNCQLKGPELSDKPIFEKMQWRLKQVIPLVESGHWQQGMAMGLTSTPLTTREQLHEFVELVAPEGSSVIYKTGLGAVFVASELHLLADESKDYDETWVFLRSRLEELESGSFVNIFDSKIPMAASTAVASSLLEGVSSLLRPVNTSMPGTKPSDYDNSRN